MSGLRPVSFKKGRKFLPRLSTPYVPGRHAKRYWTDEENQILREHYPTKGFPFCASRLENRSKLSIYQQANKLGLKFVRREVDMSGTTTPPSMPTYAACGRTSRNRTGQSAA